MVQILGKMEANNITNGLKHLSEGLFLPEEWIDWWEQNEKFAKQFLSSRWYLKIKPKMSQGLIGATLISQNAAREYLKSINQSYNKSSQINYMEGWSKQIDNISLNYDKVYIIDFDLKFTKLKQNYPNLFAAIKENLLQCDVVENNITEEKLASSPFYKLLHSDMIAFFCCVSQLKMEGVFIGFNMLELRGEYIKIGELWLNNDGDELYIKPHETSAYFHDIEKNQIRIMNKSFNLFIENDLSRFVSENA
jgi:hypothetical protein